MNTGATPQKTADAPSCFEPKLEVQDGFDCAELALSSPLDMGMQNIAPTLSLTLMSPEVHEAAAQASCYTGLDPLDCQDSFS